MTPYDLNGPWVGRALRERPPLPYNILRRRQRVKIAFVILTILVAVFGGLAGLANLPVPQL